MHEASQRRLVRTTFVLTCLVPTLGVVGWAIAWRLEFHADRLQRQLSQQLGLVVQAAQLNHPRPNRVHMRRVQLLDPETNAELAWFDRLEFTKLPSEWTIDVDHAAIQASQIPRITQLMRARLSPGGQMPRRRRLSCKTVEVVDGSARTLLYNANGTARSLADSVRTSLSFAMHDQAETPRVEVAMVRERAASALQTQIDLDTGKGSLPVGILSRAAERRLGSEAVFQGICRVEYRDDQWHRTTVAGSLDRVDSERWMVEPIPYRLTGRGRIELQQLEFSRHGIEQAVGRMQIEKGTIDSELLRSLADLGLVILDPAIHLGEKRNEPFAFRDLAIEVQMDSNGLTIRAPRADVTLNPEPRPIATSEDGKAIFEPKHRLPVDHLVFAIVPLDLQGAFRTATRFQRILPRPEPRLQKIVR